MVNLQRSLSLFLILALLASCELLGPGSQAVAKLEIVSGDKQTARIGEPLPRDLVIRLVDSLSAPVPGAKITWSVNSKFGSIEGDSVADAQGYARAKWTLSTTAGEVTASVSPTGVRGEWPSLSATATPGPIASVRLVAGTGQSAVEGNVLPDSLVIAVADSFSNPIPGVRVDWKVTRGGGLIRTSANPVTNRHGLATASWQIGIALPNAAIAVVGRDTVQFRASPTLLSPRDTVRLNSGLMYLDIRMTADTAIARNSRMVAVAYSEFLLDGTLLQRVRNGGDGPLRFILGAPGVIPGFNEGVSGMRKGSIRRLVVPPAIGYNDGQTRVYDVELVDLPKL